MSDKILHALLPAAATGPVFGRAPFLSRGGAGGAQGEGVSVIASSPFIPATARLTLSRAYASPAKRRRINGAEPQTEKETEWQSPSLL